MKNLFWGAIFWISRNEVSFAERFMLHITEALFIQRDNPLEKSVLWVKANLRISGRLDPQFVGRSHVYR